MTSEFPLVTIIVPARPGQVDIPAVSACRTLEYSLDRLEIIVARGTQPAAQRNAAVKQAKGEVVYFLDDDARPAPGNLLEGVTHFRRPEVQMVGGPNVCPGDAPFLEQVFAIVLSSWLAFGPSRARYEPVGKLRVTSEKELILCNLMVRREGLLQAGGFDESLYPNEENALMDELQKSGGKLVYDPQLIVYRRPRPNLPAFARMLFRYGRGRAEQFRLHPTPGSALNFVPPLFCLYLLAVPFLGVPGLIPLNFYFLAVVLQTLASALGRGGWKSLFALPLLILTHICYGIGFWRGLFTPLKKQQAQTPQQISLESVML